MDTDNLLRSQASQLGVALSARIKTIFPKDGGSRDLVVGYDVGGSVAQAQNAARAVRAAMTPAPGSAIEGWLAELSVTVVSRASDDFTAELRLEAYAARLGQYPADVARAAIFRKPAWQFWPSWAELEAECEVLVASRRHMLAALESPEAPEQPEPRARVSPEAAADILESAGFTPKRFGDMQRARMATTFAAAEAQADKPRAPHWTETVAPDSPEMEALRRARDENPLIAKARAAAARKADEGAA